MEGFELLDVAGPIQVFDSARDHGAPYEIRLVGMDSCVTSAQGIVMHCQPGLPEVAAGDHVVVPGVEPRRRDLISPPILDWLRSSAAAGARISSICAGAFVLGHAGLLNGRRCTTHWELTKVLANRFPNTTVSDDALFVDDGPITSSAGVASGIDLALWLLERDYGPLITAKVARALVVYLRRDGTHLQMSVYLDYRTHLNLTVHRAQDWIQAHFTGTLTLDDIGREVGLSGRHLARAFKVATGLTPLAYQHLLRLELARTLMSSPELSLETISARCGFGDVRSFRRVWRDHFGTSPSDTRRSLTKTEQPSLTKSRRS